MLSLQNERLGLRNRIEKKAAYLEELEEQVRKIRLDAKSFFSFSGVMLLLLQFYKFLFLGFSHFSFKKYVGLQNLIQRNEQLYGSGNAPSGGVALPFILVQVSMTTSLLLLLTSTSCL